MEQLKVNFLNEAVDNEAYKTINPTPETKYTDELKSSEVELDKKINIMIGREGHFPKWETEASDDIETEKVRYNAAVDYLYLLANNSQDESRPIDERRQWADAYTEQSIKLYGRPDPDVAKIIEMNGGEKLIEHYQPVLDAVKSWLLKKYGDVFDAMGLDNMTEKLTPPEILDVFTRGLDKLKSNDPRWLDWQVEMKPDATVLSCESADKKVFVGEKRASADPGKLKGLFAHEILRHGMTAVNGEDLGIQSALPRYTNAEEGFAKIYELALSGEIPTTSMEKYADIAWCLGDIDGQKHTRAELVERKLNRKREKGEKVTEKSETIAYNTANRIFRGTPGSNKVSGIFTKDLSYFGGFVPGVEFIKQGLDAGKDIDEIMSFANAAKFDPNDSVQRHYIESKILDRYLPKFPPALPAPE